MIKAILLGHGYLGKWHAQKLSQHPGVEFVGIIEPYEASHSAIKLLYPNLKISKNLESFEGAYDAAIVVTPSSTHAATVKYLLEMGKHVFCEKPLVTSSKEAREVSYAFKENSNLILNIGHSERCHEGIELLINFLNQHQLLQMIEDKKARGFFSFNRLGLFKERALDVTVIDDLMIHDLDLMNLILKKMSVRPIFQSSSAFKVASTHWDWCKAQFIAPQLDIDIFSSRVSHCEKRSIEIRLNEWEIELNLMERTLSIKKNNKFFQEIITYEARDHLLLEQEVFFNQINEKIVQKKVEQKENKSIFLKNLTQFSFEGTTIEDALVACEQVEKIKEFLAKR